MQALDRPPPPDVEPPAPTGWRRASVPLIAGGLVAAGCAYVLLNDPNSSGAYPQCPLKAMTGLDCPGCGMTRAVHALLQGDVIQAGSHNLLFVLALPFIIYAVVRWLGAKMGYELPKPFSLQPWMLWVAVPLLAAFFIARNISGLPLSWLDATA